MKFRFVRLVFATALTAPSVFLLSANADAAAWRLVGWNNLGMHCMDAEFSLFSLLPPFNSIQAQLIDPQGRLVTDATGIRVTYEAVADASGSINSTSVGKTNFWDHEDDLFGVSLAPDEGLAPYPMPGAANVPQDMTFDPASSQFLAPGIPITPYDDAGFKNTYPMMRLVARSTAGTVLATTDIVLPVSDEMSCKSCHASGTSAEARPASGWANVAGDDERDVRLNVLRLHDDNQRGNPAFTQALAELGMNPDGLEATAVGDGRSVLCASCHLSEALPGSGRPGIAPLTQAMHASMADSIDPATGMALDDTANRSACYTCHPGSATKCLRGAMGAAVATDGSMAMQCQSCHGGMRDVGAATRTGWLDEPRCDSCHTGNAVKNNGQIRYASVFESPGVERVAVDDTFATNDDTPAPGLSLYRFSTGHGGLQCASCHGATHAEYPSSHASDNVQSLQIQGHKGVLADCSSCHASVPATASGGPHGMHPIGEWWIKEHHDYVDDAPAQCQSCHGKDYRGTVLSRALGDRAFRTEKFGTKRFFQGSQIGCYACHAGPQSSSTVNNRPPVAIDATVATTATAPVTVPLVATDPDGNALALRIVSQPTHGTVGLVGTNARYYPDGVFAGVEAFTFAAWDGSIDSNLATVTVTVGGEPCTPGCELPGGGCDPDCGATPERDAMVVAPAPRTVRIPAGTAVLSTTAAVTVRNMDAVGATPGPVRLDVEDGDCPTGTVAGAPGFPGGGATVTLAPGESATASVALAFDSADYTTTSKRALARCRLVVRAVAVDAVDPVPSNDQASLELSVNDANDYGGKKGRDVVLTSIAPLSVTLTGEAELVTVVRRTRIRLDGPAGGGSASVRLVADDGTCPAGTIAGVDLDAATPGGQDTRSLKPGRAVRGRVFVRVRSQAFDTPAAPVRCTALASVVYEGEGGPVENDLTEFALTVLDLGDR